MRVGLCVLIGGLLAYTYVILELPGGHWMFENIGVLAGILAILIGNSLGLAAAMIWRTSRS